MVNVSLTEYLLLQLEDFEKNSASTPFQQGFLAATLIIARDHTNISHKYLTKLEEQTLKYF